MTPSWESPDLARARAASPLAPLAPLVTALLSAAVEESGLTLIIADATGRPLWIEGSPLPDVVLGRPWRPAAPVVQRPGPHRAPGVAAAPVRDPRSGDLAGVLAVSGSAAADGGFVLAALRGAAAVVESHLATRSSSTQDSAPVGSSSALALLRLTGPDAPTLDTPYGTTQLGLRHAELLACLAHSPAGMSAAHLGQRVFSEPVSAVTLRAEIARLRRVLESSGATEAGVVLSSRPYRLSGVETDEARVGALLDRGALPRAISEYGGELLPASDSPELSRRRTRLSASIRGAVMASASLQPLLAWLRLPEAQADVEAWELAEALVPSSSPHHARITAHLASLH
ncbi:hypothetical protein [Galactobacter sp.]|uniref:hypothetical protein n=1 Tax=Galactobacter sp. TaxID=2676125 RepID=UPI0025BC7649|nr:hypothetical protein [Galactobacter sp.]